MHCIVGSNGIELDIDTCISIKKMITNDHSSDLQGHFYHLLGNKDDKWNIVSFYLSTMSMAYSYVPTKSFA